MHKECNIAMANHWQKNKPLHILGGKRTSHAHIRNYTVGVRWVLPNKEQYRVGPSGSLFTYDKNN